jgi:hypothetical protein
MKEALGLTEFSKNTSNRINEDFQMIGDSSFWTHLELIILRLNKMILRMALGWPSWASFTTEVI